MNPNKYIEGAIEKIDWSEEWPDIIGREALEKVLEYAITSFKDDVVARLEERRDSLPEIDYSKHVGATEVQELAKRALDYDELIKELTE